jgi:hypothetical protein
MKPTWDAAMAALARAMAQGSVPVRNLLWNELQRRASANAGVAPGRVLWPQAFLHLSPQDVLEIAQEPAVTE